MGTITFECGCSISSSMFGEREIVDVHICEKHKQHRKIKTLLQTHKNRLALEITNIIKKEKK